MASASHGVNRIFEEVNVYRFRDAQGNNFSSFGHAGATSHWSDQLTIGKAGQTGTGTFSGSVRVTGTFSETSRNSLFGNVRFDGGLTINSRTAGFRYDDFTLLGTEASPLPGTVDQFLVLNNVPFTFGVPFGISMEMKMSGTKSGTASFAATQRFLGDAGNSATWEGISSVMDAQGNSVSGYSATGSSGTSYITAIPEPGSVCLIGLGILAVGFVRYRRAS